MTGSPGPFPLTGCLKKLQYDVAALVVCFCTRASPLALIVLGSTSCDAGSVPAGWQIEANHGTPEISPCKYDDTTCVHLKSVKSSFALQRGVDIDPAEMPYLTWRWKVSQLPAGGGFRRARTDDQAAQVLVAFADRRVVTYIWDTHGAVIEVGVFRLKAVIVAGVESQLGLIAQADVQPACLVIVTVGVHVREGVIRESVRLAWDIGQVWPLPTLPLTNKNGSKPSLRSGFANPFLTHVWFLARLAENQLNSRLTFSS
jgi:hypothetical protein